MSIVVPFDDTPLSRAALARAHEFASPLGADIVVVSVIPRNREYARARGWLGESDPFELESVVEALAARVTDLAPDATFKYTTVGRRGAPGSIAGEIRKFARDVDADLVVIGSDNAGQIVTDVSSVGGAVAADSAYDVLIVRHESS